MFCFLTLKGESFTFATQPSFEHVSTSHIQACFSIFRTSFTLHIGLKKNSEYGKFGAVVVVVFDIFGVILYSIYFRLYHALTPVTECN